MEPKPVINECRHGAFYNKMKPYEKEFCFRTSHMAGFVIKMQYICGMLLEV